MKLRLAGGSYPEVKRVFAFDPAGGQALVLVCYHHDGNREALAEVSVREMEAINEKGEYGDVPAELLRRAGYVVRSPDHGF